MSTLNLLNENQKRLEIIEKERHRLDENRACSSSPIKIMQYNDTPMICDLSRLGVYAKLREHLYLILDERENELLEERKHLAEQLLKDQKN